MTFQARSDFRALTVPLVPYRPGLPPRPSRVAALPLDGRGYPIPWFVARVNGVPDFRVVDGKKLARAVRERRCWICGDTLGRIAAIPVGPLCVVNRISAEGPCHRDCAEYALLTCPFILNPSAKRREGGLPPDAACAGQVIARNPGVMALWVGRSFPLLRPPGGGVLFHLQGEPESVSWWKEGRPATLAEVREAFRTGTAELAKQCESEEAMVEMLARVAAASAFWPAADFLKGEVDAVE